MVGNVFGRDLSEDFNMIMPKLLHGFVRLGCNLQVFNDREMARGSTPLLRSAAGRAAANRKLLMASRHFRPDLLLRGQRASFSKGTIHYIRAEDPVTHTSYSNVNHTLHPSNIQQI